MTDHPECEDEPDGRCPNCGEDAMDGGMCRYCGWHSYNCGLCDDCRAALDALGFEIREKNDD